MYVVVKNPDAKVMQYFGKTDWTKDRSQAVKFQHMHTAVNTAKAMSSKTAAAIPA